MKNMILLFALFVLMTGSLLAQKEPTVTDLMLKDLDGSPGKEVLMIAVEYPPGGADPVHKHNAPGFIYVLEGSIVMQVKGGKAVTLTPGQTFYEGQDDTLLAAMRARQRRRNSSCFLLKTKRHRFSFR